MFFVMSYQSEAKISVLWSLLQEELRKPVANVPLELSPSRFLPAYRKGYTVCDCCLRSYEKEKGLCRESNDGSQLCVHCNIHDPVWNN